MLLRDMIQGMPYLRQTRGNIDIAIKSIVSVSQEKAENGLFFCIVGGHVDAHEFASQAVENGCVALIVERFIKDVKVPQVLVSNARAAMSRIAAKFYGDPAKNMRLVGITGTKGKTTTTYMLKAICENAGFKCGLIGTTGAMIGSEHLDCELTTPNPIELQKILRLMADSGVQIVCMEISAHAVEMFRLDGLTFEIGCYTNLSRDHLNYFHTMQRYFEAKKRFFANGMVQNATINADDEKAAQIIEGLSMPHITYGICVNADVFARDIEIMESGMRFCIRLHGTQDIDLDMRLTGRFNVYNALAAASCALIMGIDTKWIQKGLNGIKNVPGRMEVLQTDTPYKVILDFSHTPVALENILTTVRQFTKKRIIALYGCGGDRDIGKREMMGEIGGRFADYCILTSDNPRLEDPMVILDSIEAGIKPTGTPYEVIEDRRKAIRRALEMAEEGDVIILAGKGAETWQEIKGVRRAFDEKVIVSELLKEMQMTSGREVET